MQDERSQLDSFVRYPLFFFAWNTASHVQDNEQSPEKRAFTKQELQNFFDHADDQLSLIAASKKKGWLPAPTEPSVVQHSGNCLLSEFLKIQNLYELVKRSRHLNPFRPIPGVIGTHNAG
jgi:hypothetical protein